MYIHICLINVMAEAYNCLMRRISLLVLDLAYYYVTSSKLIDIH